MHKELQMILINDFSDYLKTTTVSENTVRAYVAGMRNYAGFFDEVNTENIRQYRHLCLQTQKPKTVNLRLHALVKYARWQQIDAKASLVEIQEPLFAENPLSPSEYRRILSHLFNTGQTDWYIAIRTLACTGVRIGESFQITVGDLRQGRKVILGKGTKTRVIWFPQQFRKDLAPLLQGRKPEDRLIVFTEDYIRTKLRKLKTELNIKCRLSPHELRRFYARQVYSKTKDIYLVKDLLGHASIKTTMQYLRISVSSISRRMSRIVDW